MLNYSGKARYLPKRIFCRFSSTWNFVCCLSIESRKSRVEFLLSRRGRAGEDNLIISHFNRIQFTISRSLCRKRHRRESFPSTIRFFSKWTAIMIVFLLYVTIERKFIYVLCVICCCCFEALVKTRQGRVNGVVQEAAICIVELIS